MGDLVLTLPLRPRTVLLLKCHTNRPHIWHRPYGSEGPIEPRSSSYLAVIYNVILGVDRARSGKVGFILHLYTALG